MRTLSRSLDLDFVSTGVLYVVVVVVTSAAVDFSCSLVLQRVTLLHSCISTPLLFSAPFIANVSCIVAWVCWWLACCLLSFADLERCSLLVVDRIDLLLEHRRRRCCNKPTALCYRHSLIPHPPHAIVVVVVVVGTIRLFELAGWASVYFQCDCERLLLSTCADSHRYKHHVSISLSLYNCQSTLLVTVMFALVMLLAYMDIAPAAFVFLIPLFILIAPATQSSSSSIKYSTN
jgi:hypothetical protein